MESEDESYGFELYDAKADDYLICKNLIRSLVNIRLDYEQTKYMWQVMKVLRRKPLETKNSQGGEPSTQK